MSRGEVPPDAAELAARLAAELAVAQVQHERMSLTVRALLDLVGTGNGESGLPSGNTPNQRPQESSLFSGLVIKPEQSAVSARELTGATTEFEQSIYNRLSPTLLKLDEDFAALLRKKPQSWWTSISHRHKLPAEGELWPMSFNHSFEYSVSQHAPATLTRVLSTQNLREDGSRSATLTTDIGLSSAGGLHITDLSATWRSRQAHPALSDNFRETFGSREGRFVPMLDALATDQTARGPRTMRLGRVSLAFKAGSPTIRFGSAAGNYIGFREDYLRDPFREENSYAAYSYDPATGRFNRVELVVEGERNAELVWLPEQLTEDEYLLWLDFALATLTPADTPAGKRATLPVRAAAQTATAKPTSASNPDAVGAVDGNA